MAQPPKRSPLESPGFWSIISLSFLDGIVALGARRPLEVEDMHELPDRLKSVNIAQRFRPYWEHEQRSSPRPSFTRALLRAYWRRLVVASSCVLGYAVLIAAQPFFMGAILRYVQGDKDASVIGISSGVGLAVALSLCTLLGSIIFNAGFYHMYASATLMCVTIPHLTHS
jgi:ATP-binding cassette subfamily C (CFTR/MRP) protein 4